MFLRQLRKSAYVGLLYYGMKVSQRASTEKRVERLRGQMRFLTRSIPPIRRIIRRNMVEVGVYREGLLDAHLERAIDQFIMLAHVFRGGMRGSGVFERFRFDDSLDILKETYNRGKGVVCIAPHICGYPLFPPVVQPHVPCSIYLRRNASPFKMSITESIGEAGEGHLVSPPPGASKSERLKVALDVLREGRMLFITPDTPKRPDDGVPVRVFGRTAYFPTGVFVMSLRTGAPIVPVYWHWKDDAYHVEVREPIELQRGRNLKQLATDATQHWAEMNDEFLRRHPEMWWNWLDKRWTRILRNTDGAAIADHDPAGDRPASEPPRLQFNRMAQLPKPDDNSESQDSRSLHA